MRGKRTLPENFIFIRILSGNTVRVREPSFIRKRNHKTIRVSASSGAFGATFPEGEGKRKECASVIDIENNQLYF